MKETLSELIHPSALEDRRKTIQALTAGELTATHFVRGEAGYLELPVVQVDHANLVYRADNGRILVEFAGQQTRCGLSDEARRKSHDDVDTQTVLHELLIEKAQDQDAPIFQALQDHRLQTEPLLITRDGVVINGNRRLASMRALLRRDPETYAGFSSVDTAVLPEDITREAIEYIEAALQMAPDLKLAYGWINRRLKLREHARDLTGEQVLGAYGFSSGQDVATELSELELAEEFLGFSGRRKDYEAIADCELFFQTLRKNLNSLQAEHLRRAWKAAGFCMIASRRVLSEPISHYYPFADNNLPALPNWVMRTLASDRGLARPQSIGENEPLNCALADRLQPLVSDYSRAEDNARHLVSLIDTLKAEQTSLLGVFRVLNQLRGARKGLEQLGCDQLTDQQVRQIRAEVLALQYISKELPVEVPVRRVGHGLLGKWQDYFRANRLKA